MIPKNYFRGIIWTSPASLVWHAWAITHWKWLANLHDYLCPEGDGG